MKTIKSLLIIGLLSFSSAIFAAENAKPSTSLKIEGSVSKPLVLTVADLQKLNQTQFEGVDVYCQSGELKDQADQLTGVPLKLVLQQAGIKVNHPKDFRKIAIIAKATDDYWVTFSYGEIFNQLTTKPVLVYFAKNGKLLDDQEGAIALMPMSDEKMGGRQVKWMESIEVRLLDRN